MSTLLPKLLLAASLALLAALAPAQTPTADVTDLAALRTATKADKRAFVAATLGLTDAEATKFWPLYDAYQRALDAAIRQRNRVIEDVVALNRPLSDAYARALVKDVMEADEAELRARRKLLNALLKALPPKKAARYLQLEGKIRTVSEYDIAATIPLVR